ncbi:hypothetical protein LCGC14_0235750 [marine sediment metagenome]|uniref:Uncharacterized protein n=1 Tax=marine sediment metagenome TaxID=412755 RepID=A0A0F9UDI3_9ZZZZ
MAEDSLANAAGKGVTLTIKGKEYEFSPITLGDLADFEKHIRSEKLNIFMLEAKDLPVAERKEIIIELCRQGLDPLAVEQHMNSLDGVRFLLWKSLSKKHPDLTLDGVSELVDMQNLEEVSAVVQSIGAGDAVNPPDEEVSP